MRVAPRWVRNGVIICLILLVIGFGALRTGVVRGGLLLVGLYGLLGLFLRTWLIVTAQTRQWLVDHPDWGDGRRFAALVAVLLGIPVVGLVLGGILLILLAALDGLATGR
jgi:hypothetical protein